MKNANVVVGAAMVSIWMLAFGWTGNAHASKPSPPAPVKFLCALHGLSAVQRTEHRGLMMKLQEGVQETRELEDGFALRVDAAHLDLAGLSRWVELERHCCPFFHFTIEVEPDGGPTWLHLTGPTGVKSFIRSEMGKS